MERRGGATVRLKERSLSQGEQRGAKVSKGERKGERKASGG
jgi:hypothetical protein